MKHKQLLAVALLAASPAFAFASAFTVDFEKAWDYGTDVNNYYNGGTASDGTSGSNLGVSFVNVSGLSNDSNFTYYTNAPSMLGTAYAYGTAFMNVAAGVDNGLSFSYSSATAVSGAILAYSGLNGTGTLLGSINLTANDTGSYDHWNVASFNFSGKAESFDLTALGANYVAFDNISPVPEMPVFWLLGSGLAMMGAIKRRVKAAA